MDNFHKFKNFGCNFDKNRCGVFIYQITVENLKKIIICSLSVLCFPRLILTRSPKISGQDKSEAREPEGLVKITYGTVASSLFKRAGNSNKEIFLNCENRNI